MSIFSKIIKKNVVNGEKTVSKEEQKKLDVQLPLDRIIKLSCCDKIHEKKVSYDYCKTNYFLLDRPLNVDEEMAKHTLGEEIFIGKIVQITGENAGDVYDLFLRDFREICIGIKVSAGEYGSGLEGCSMAKKYKDRTYITVGELKDLARVATDKSRNLAREDAYDFYKEWGCSR